MIDIGNIQLEWWQAVLAVVVAVVGSARLTRIITYDDFPPAAAVRIWWDKVTKDGSWSKLVHCPWCMGPWVTLIAMASFLVSASMAPWSDVPIALWWLFWGWLTLSYWTSQYVHFDEGGGED